ncbi:hypothetical protein D3C86_1967080 [compost metagenome]
MLPATSDTRQARNTGAMPPGWRQAIQAPSTNDCSVCASVTPQAPLIQGDDSLSASAAPRKPTEAIAKQAPQARP